MIRRALWQLKGKFRVCYIHRSEKGEHVKCISGERIVHTDSWAIYLDDDTAIPYHRIVEIRDEKGDLLWSRKGGKWS